MVEGVGRGGKSCPSRTWIIIINDKLNVLHVQTSGGHIGCYQEGRGPTLELSKDVITLTLLFVAVHAHGRNAVPPHLRDQLVHLLFGHCKLRRHQYFWVEFLVKTRNKVIKLQLIANYDGIGIQLCTVVSIGGIGSKPTPESILMMVQRTPFASSKPSFAESLIKTFCAHCLITQDCMSSLRKKKKKRGPWHPNQGPRVGNVPAGQNVPYDDCFRVVVIQDLVDEFVELPGLISFVNHLDHLLDVRAGAQLGITDTGLDWVIAQELGSKLLHLFRPRCAPHQRLPTV